MSDATLLSVVDFSETLPDVTEYPEGYAELLLSTLDNPYSPFDDTDRWTTYDERLGYHTNQLVSRLVGTPSEFGETPFGKEIENKFIYSTMLDIIRFSTKAPYVLVSPSDFTEDGLYKYYDNKSTLAPPLNKTRKPA